MRDGGVSDPQSPETDAPPPDPEPTREPWPPPEDDPPDRERIRMRMGLASLGLTVSAIIESFKEMRLAELSEFVEAFEETFNIRLSEFHVAPPGRNGSSLSNGKRHNDGVTKNRPDQLA